MNEYKTFEVSDSYRIFAMVMCFGAGWNFVNLFKTGYNTTESAVYLGIFLLAYATSVVFAFREVELKPTDFVLGYAITSAWVMLNFTFHLPLM